TRSPMGSPSASRYPCRYTLLSSSSSRRYTRLVSKPARSAGASSGRSGANASSSMCGEVRIESSPGRGSWKERTSHLFPAGRRGDGGRLARRIHLQRERGDVVELLAAAREILELAPEGRQEVVRRPRRVGAPELPHSVLAEQRAVRRMRVVDAVAVPEHEV